MEVHKGLYWYSTDQHSTANLIALPVERVREIQTLNRKGTKVDRLQPLNEIIDSAPVSQDLLKNNSLTRFDPPDSNKANRNPNRRKNRRFNDKRNR
jgi:hypothetical protein